MKKGCKRVLSALLCAVLLCGSALAFDLEAFWAQNGAALEGKGVFRYGVHEFQDGLMPVLVRNDWGYELADGWVPDTVWNYINESLEVVDLNKGRFSYVFPFFDGLAAVIGDDGVGYIDTTGTGPTTAWALSIRATSGTGRRRCSKRRSRSTPWAALCRAFRWAESTKLELWCRPTRRSTRCLT